MNKYEYAWMKSRRKGKDKGLINNNAGDPHEKRRHFHSDSIKYQIISLSLAC